MREDRQGMRSNLLHLENQSFYDFLSSQVEHVLGECIVYFICRGKQEDF